MAPSTNTKAMTYPGRRDNGVVSASGARQSGHRISPSYAHRPHSRQRLTGFDGGSAMATLAEQGNGTLPTEQ
jgi:hypothetical protein